MKISRPTTFAIPPRWLFLKIETEEGATGWGEPVVEGRAATGAPPWTNCPTTWAALEPGRHA
jgi:L-alanine-DL-glutamate epimerase-like enolase superfamily enzyme